MNVSAEVVIDRPREVVAGYAMEPLNDPEWIGGITEAKMITAPPVAEGTEVERKAAFLGKEIEYVLGVTEHEPAALLAMRSIQGPFPMVVTYRFEDAGSGTRMQIQVSGDASGFYKLAAPLMSVMVRHNIARDLKALKRLLESGAAGHAP